jgi:hypothetical protein
MYSGNDKTLHSGSGCFPQKLRQPGLERFKIEMAMAVNQAGNHTNHPNRLTTHSMTRIRAPRRS